MTFDPRDPVDEGVIQPHPVDRLGELALMMTDSLTGYLSPEESDNETGIRVIVMIQHGERGLVHTRNYPDRSGRQQMHDVLVHARQLAEAYDMEMLVLKAPLEGEGG